jgi:succinoglycan biosynthesis transport protein ExoP
MEHRTSSFERALEIWGRRRALVLACVAAGAAATFSLALFLPNVYRASATVVVERPQVAEAVVRPDQSEEIESRLRMINERVLSRSRLSEMITRLGLYPDLRGRVPMEDVIGRMRRDMRLELKGVDQTTGRGTTIAFTLGYRGTDPATVARVANTLASFYVEEDRETRRRQTEGTADFLKQQLDAAQQRLDGQESRIGEYKRQHGRELPEQMEANLAALERLNTQLRLNSEGQIRALERRDDLARDLAATGAPGPGGEPETAAGRLARLKRDLADLLTRYSDRYPDVVRLREEIAVLERRVAEAPDAAAAEPAAPPDPDQIRRQDRLRAAQAEVQALRAEEKNLRAAIDSFQRGVEQAPQREQELHELSRDYLTTRDEYESLMKRYNEARVAESLEERQKGESFRVLDEAVVPAAPAGPKRVELVLAGLLMSLGLAALAVAVAEKADTSFHSAGELRAFTRVPVLTTIPRIVTRSDLRRRRRRVVAALIPTAACLVLIVGGAYVLARSNNPLIWTLLAR